jgi:hypothetical protein
VALGAADTKSLARLVRKYGRNKIIGAAKEVAVRGPGRPPCGDLPYFERLALAGMIEEWAEEYRLQGSQKPIKNALLDLYEVEHGGEPEKPDLQKYLKTQKRKLIPARRELQALRVALLSLKKQRMGCE